jgi:ankyrin repeat protein
MLALPVELILDVAEHLPVKDLVHLARSDRWLFRLLSPRIDTIALEYPVPGCLHRPSVLLWAVANNHPGLVKRLVALGAPIHGARNGWELVNPPIGPIGVQSALDLAIEKGHYEVAEILLAHGAEVNAPDPYFFREPIYTAAVYDKIEIAELLLTYGANPHQQTGYETTALHTAAEFRSHALVEKLISLGADVNARDDYGQTPLHYVALTLKTEEHNNSPSATAGTIAKLLLDAGAEIDIRTRVEHGSQTALHYAAHYGNPTVLRVLLERGADVDAADEYGNTSLHTAATGEYGGTAPLRVPVVQLLLRYGADLNARNLDGDTPLDTTLEYEPSDDYDIEPAYILAARSQIQSLLRP